MTDRVGRADYGLGADPTQLRADLAAAEAAIKQAGRTAESAFGRQAAQGMAQAEKQARSLRGTLLGIAGNKDIKRGILGGLGLGAGFGTALAIQKGMQIASDAIAGTVDAAATLDDAMTKSLAIMGDVSDAMRTDMTDAARQVAKETTFSASQAADAYFYLASAGLDAAASLKAMPLVARFAQAGNFDLALATDLLTDAQSALGLTIRDDVVANMRNMAAVSDVLVKANTLANATVQQFSESLTNKGGAALRLVNKELEEGVAVLATWADQGVKGAEAGTRLDIVLRDLANAAIKQAGAFERFGISVFDAQGEMRGMADIVADMERAFDGLSTKQVRAGLATLGFQQRTVSATVSLLGSSGAIRRYQTALEAAGGTTRTVAEKQLESFKAQAILLDNALVDLSITAGQALIPVLKDIAVAIREDILPELGRMFDELRRLDPAFDLTLRFGRAWDDLMDKLSIGSTNDELEELRTQMLGFFREAAAQGASVDDLVDSLRAFDLGAGSVGVQLIAIRSRMELTARASAQLAREHGAAAAAADAAAEAVKALDDDLEALAASGFKDVRESARETQQALRQAFRAPDSMKALLKEERQLIAARQKAIRLKDEDAFAIAEVALADNRAQQDHVKGVRAEMRAIEERRAERRADRQAAAAASKAARRDFIAEQVALGKTTEQARKLWQQTQKDHGIDIPVDSGQIDTALSKLDQLAAKLGIGAGTLASQIIGGASARPHTSVFGEPKYHSGTSFVPRTGLALLERGERVISKEDNRMLDSRKTMQLLSGQVGGTSGGGSAEGTQVVEQHVHIDPTIQGLPMRASTPREVVAQVRRAARMGVMLPRRPLTWSQP